MALSGEQADEFLRSLGKLEALDATQDDFGRNFLDNLQGPPVVDGNTDTFTRAMVGLSSPARPPLPHGTGNLDWRQEQAQLAALASSLVSQRPENTMYRLPGTVGQPTYSLPLTNLARMSADAVMGGSYFSHQIGRNSFENMLDAPYGQHTALNRRSADASLPAGRNLPPPRISEPIDLHSLHMPAEQRANSGNSGESMHDGLYTSMQAGMDPGMGQDFEGDMNLEFSPEELQKQREKNRNAQKRFRQRQKEKMRDSQKQLEQLTQQMSRLMQEKAELETRNRILEQVVKLNVDHVEQLQTNKEVMDIEQGILLDGYAQFVSKVERKPELTGEDAKKWLMGDLMETGFQRYIDRISELYVDASKDPSSPAHRELHELVTMRREHEKQGALFSCFYWAVYSWNIHETEKRRDEMPTSAHWTKVLAGLRLSKEQESEMLTARRRMLNKLNVLVEHRRAIISQLGLELLQTAQDQLHTCPAVQELRKSLEAEREAVFNFLFTAVDDTLTPAQEAYLDMSCYPWSPSIWELSNLLSQKRKEPMMPIPNMDVGGAVLAPILPYATAFKLLTTPITSVGIGLRLKRGIVMCPFHNTAPAAAFPIPSQDKLRNMTLLAVQCGRWKRWSYWDWHNRFLQANQLISNELTEEDSNNAS